MKAGDDAGWQTQTDLVQACLSEMLEMSAPTATPSKGAPSRYIHRPVADKLNRAMSHVRSMLTAMRDRDRTTALAYGETTARPSESRCLANAAYIRRRPHGFGFAGYLRLYEENERRMAGAGTKGATDYPASVFLTWQTTVDQLPAGARRTLQLHAWVAPAAFPVDLYVRGVTYTF